MRQPLRHAGRHLRANRYLLAKLRTGNCAASRVMPRWWNLPLGELRRVEMGEDVPGIGVAREIKREGNSWVLETSRGSIRPR